MGLSATATDFWSAVLNALGAPPTPLNVGELASWSSREGTSAAWNPLATTVKEPGSSPFNSIGVQNFSSMFAGEQATAQTLREGYYAPIVADLQAGVPLGASTQQALRIWSFGGYSSLPNDPGYNSPAFGAAASGPSPAPASSAPAAGPAAASSSSSIAPQPLGSVLGAQAVGGLSNLLHGISSWFDAPRLIGVGVAVVALYMGFGSRMTEGPNAVA